MKISELEITAGTISLILTNQRAAYCKVYEALILSDLHVGKTAHFRKHGIAVPNGVLSQDLERLASLITHFNAKKVIIVGDMLHAGDNSDVDLFCSWRQGFSAIEFHLVEGNHDRLSKTLEAKLCLTYRDCLLRLGALNFIHNFDPLADGFQVTGHIHPGVVIHTAVSRFRLPCYTLSEKQLLLPAFSKFTGLDTRNTRDKGEIYAFTDQEIFKL